MPPLAILKRPVSPHLAQAALLLLLATACGMGWTDDTSRRHAPPISKVTRNPLKWPFSSDSIWNMPIGSRAAYVPARLSATPGDDKWAPMPQIDEERIVLTPHAPLTDVRFSDAGWSGANRCDGTDEILLRVPIPKDYVVPGNGSNSSAVFLAKDARTLLHTQPFARCRTGAPGTSMRRFDEVDLYGDGRTGSHGGSGLSAIGGSLRIGELRPGKHAPRHALKVNVYAKEALHQCRMAEDCFRWPAVTADGYAVGHYGIKADGVPKAMKMGALLAIPTSMKLSRLGLETEPAKQLAWTLQNYGAYIVDDTYGPAFALNAEHGPDGSFREQFRQDWGFDMEQRVKDNSPWVRDMQRLVRALHVVANNSPASVGGGGKPRQPLAPPLPRTHQYP